MLAQKSSNRFLEQKPKQQKRFDVSTHLLGSVYFKSTFCSNGVVPIFRLIHIWRFRWCASAIFIHLWFEESEIFFLLFRSIFPVHLLAAFSYHSRYIIMEARCKANRRGKKMLYFMPWGFSEWTIESERSLRKKKQEKKKKRLRSLHNIIYCYDRWCCSNTVFYFVETFFIVEFIIFSTCFLQLAFVVIVVVAVVVFIVVVIMNPPNTHHQTLVPPLPYSLTRSLTHE